MKRLLHTPLALLVWRIALLYAALMLCRAAFWVYNAALLGPPVWSELGQLVAGSLKFDTVSVVYADGVFILLSLLPLHLRERRWYRGMLFWYYLIVNAVLIAAANLADTVYFRYTQKRFTADEIFFADNDNSLQLAGKFMAENWYLVLLMGQDQWANLKTWKSWQELTDYANLAVFNRGKKRLSVPQEIASWAEEKNVPADLITASPSGSVCFFQMAPHEANSSEIRKLLAAPASLQNAIKLESWLPHGVALYINQHGLYRPKH